jgi:hypothetical protein
MRKMRKMRKWEKIKKKSYRASAPTSFYKEAFFCRWHVQGGCIVTEYFCTGKASKLSRTRVTESWQSTFVQVQQVKWVMKESQSLADTQLEQAAIFPLLFHEVPRGGHIRLEREREREIQGLPKYFVSVFLLRILLTIAFFCRKHFARSTGPHDTGWGIDGYQMHRGRVFMFTRWAGGSLGACGMRIIYCNYFYPINLEPPERLTIVPLNEVRIFWSSSGPTTLYYN